MTQPKPLVALSVLLIAASVVSGQPAEPKNMPKAIPVWRSDFEDPNLGDWSYLGKERFARDGQPGSDWTEAYTITSENVFTGSRAYKGWITGPKNKSHRAYPCQHFKNAPSPIVNSWYVWLDVDSSRFRTGDWIHFATWCNSRWGPGLHTMSVRGRSLKLEMAHCKWKWVGPGSMRRLPMRTWVRFTYYAHFAPKGDGTIWIWMNGTLIFKANKPHSDPNFQTAHWGMYASGPVDNGVQFNDDIKVWRLTAPWPDASREPPSPYGPYYDRPVSARRQRVASGNGRNGKTQEAKPIVVAKPKPAAPTAELVAQAKEAAIKLRQAIVSGAGQGKRQTVYIDFAGRTMRAKLRAADAQGVFVQAQGVETPIAWDSLSPRRFYGIARKYSEDHQTLATYCRGMGLLEEARKEDGQR